MGKSGEKLSKQISVLRPYIEPTPEQAAELYKWACESYEALGTYQAVADLLGCSRALVWRIINEPGYVPKRREVWQRFQELRGQMGHLHILPVGVYAVEDIPPGTVILGRPKRCPICGGIFIFPYAQQKYDSEECRREARRRRRRARRTAQRREHNGETETS